MTYIMESEREGQRLRAQEAANPSRARLVAAGIQRGMRVADVGCGSGAVLPLLLELIGPEGSVVGIDASAERLREARSLVGDDPRVELRHAALPELGLPESGFDFVWSQFVFEYLRAPAPALAALVRIARPGGRVAVADMDGFGLGIWPEPPGFAAGRDAFLKALASTGFDLFVGRKLFTLFRQAGLTDVRVGLSPLHISAGPADAQLQADWKLRFETLAPIAIPAFGSKADYDDFTQGYLAMLNDPNALKYAVALTTDGQKPT